ncbi:transcription termination factor, RNA polymerase II [Halocaridina rubra]|uniref:Transcription termination factor 2 n=1 Tax=Halocaridina rubra TaxID=373956 RepID=A0AAN9A9Q3_HALRR
MTSELDVKNAKLEELKTVYRAANPRSLPDGGEKLRKRITEMEKEIMLLQLKSNIDKQTSPVEVIQVEGPSMNYEQSKLTDYGYLTSVSKTKGKSQQPKSAFELNALYEIAVDYTARDYGGKISSSREREMLRMTGEAVENLHQVISNAPDTDVDEEEDPEGLCVPLMPHQRRSLAWLLYRESQLPRGGILADDMGLGKTLTMLALVLKHREYVKSGIIAEDFESENDSNPESGNEDSEEEDDWIRTKKAAAFGNMRKKSLVPSRGTLVVCPASLLGQWEGEVKRRLSSSLRIKCLVYHGNSRDVHIDILANYDIVVTTYQIVMRQAFPTGKAAAIQQTKDSVPKVKARYQGHLFQIGWARVILDEAHQIRNHKSKTSQAACLLRCGRRWTLTGTPIQNKELDMYSLLRFLRVKPFDDYTCWKLQVSNNSAQGMRRLNLIVKALMLRRTKDQVDEHTGNTLIDLPEKKIVEHTLSLSQEEREVYDRIFTMSRAAMTQYMMSHEERELEKKEKLGSTSGRSAAKVVDNRFTPTLASEDIPVGNVKAHHLLILLLRLRQICSHASLIKGMVETEITEADGMEDQDGLDLDLINRMEEMSLRAPSDNQVGTDTAVQNSILTIENPIFNKSYMSSKMSRVVEELYAIRTLGAREKSVVVSQWTSMLEAVEEHLREKGIRCHKITGQVAVKDRGGIVDDFNLNPKGRKVMLLSLQAGGVGLNLIGANHLFLLDMHWNPQLEAQACDRIYRVGQTKPVTIHRFVVKNTVEARILEMQQKKLQLASDILSGAKRSAHNKLTLEDMKMLFDIGASNQGVKPKTTTSREAEMVLHDSKSS